jgi:hypothetical protein
VSTPSPDPDTIYARETLEATPGRVVRFLYAVGTSHSIRTILFKHGYRRADHDEGWDLVKQACDDPAIAWPADLDETSQDAIIELDAWDERGFSIVGATLSHRYPKQSRFLLTGIGPSDGPDAVDGVRELLDRLDALEAGASESPEEDKRAIAALSRRGLGKKEREHLRQLVDVAERSQPPPMSRAITSGDPRFERLLALRAWFDEWSEIARATITRVDHLVKLGLASRRDRPAAS